MPLQNPNMPLRCIRGERQSWPVRFSLDVPRRDSFSAALTGLREQPGMPADVEFRGSTQLGSRGDGAAILDDFTIALLLSDGARSQDDTGIGRSIDLRNAA